MLNLKHYTAKQTRSSAWVHLWWLFVLPLWALGQGGVGVPTRLTVQPTRPLSGPLEVRIVQDFITHQTVAYTVPPDRDGCYRWKWHLSQPLVGHLHIGTEPHPIPLYLEPADDVTVRPLLAGPEFSGRGSTNQRMLSVLYPLQDAEQIAVAASDMAPAVARTYINRLFDTAEQTVAELQQEIEPGSGVSRWLYYTLRYQRYYHLLRYPFDFEAKYDSLPALQPDYYDFIEQPNWFDDDALCTPFYGYAVEYYLRYQGRVRQTDWLSLSNQLLRGQTLYFRIAVSVYRRLLNNRVTREAKQHLVEEHTQQGAFDTYVQVIQSVWRSMNQPNAGDWAPPIVGVNLQHQTDSVSRWRGRPLLIYFGTTWCGPCVSNLYAVQEMLQQYPDLSSATVVFVWLDDDFNDWEDQLRRWSGPHEQHLWLPDGWRNASAKRYGIGSLPATFVIGASGRIASVITASDKPTTEQWRNALLHAAQQ